VRDYDEVFKALADPHRRRIVSALMRRSMVAGELASLARLAPNAASFHLKWLKSAGLVTVHREGRFLRYQLDAEALWGWRAHLQQQWDLIPLQKSAALSTARSIVPEKLDKKPRRPAVRPAVLPSTDYGEITEELPTELL
jgi:DNA-binding transcriptional ArsR family regulator